MVSVYRDVSAGAGGPGVPRRRRKQLGQEWWKVEATQVKIPPRGGRSAPLPLPLPSPRHGVTEKTVRSVA